MSESELFTAIQQMLDSHAENEAEEISELAVADLIERFGQATKIEFTENETFHIRGH